MATVLTTVPALNVTVAVREIVEVFALAAKVTVPAPVPAVLERVTQDWLLETVQEALEATVTP